MNGIKSFLADTNILVYLLEGRSQLVPFIGQVFIISVITEIEFLGVKHIPGLSLKKRIALIEDCLRLPFDDIIKNITIEIKRETKIKTPDAIVAATAIKYKLPLLTADKGFKKIKELEAIILEL